MSSLTEAGEPVVEKIPGGFRVDGLELRSGKCGCTSVARCCYSLSRVKRRSPGLIEFTAKMTDPETRDLFDWGYTVRKGALTVAVSVQDARDKEIYSGFIPPPVREWERRGWQVLESHGQREDGIVWRCAMSKWLYKEDAQGVRFEELPDDWTCPRCGSPKSGFEKIS
jgi:rubredoxin